MRPNGLVIAIDGTAGTGKSTVGKAAAVSLGYGFLSTGELYRALAYKVFEKHIDPADETAVLALAKNLVFTFERQADAKLKMFVDGEFLGDKLHLEETGNVASKVSTHAAARAVLTEKMREAGEKGGIIMEGRDIGTVVFPDADIKFYLDATAEERANRRVKQLQAAGEQPNYDQILTLIKERDYRDSHRAASPLKPAEDAVIIDTSTLTQDQVISRILAEVNKREKSAELKKQSNRVLNLVKLIARVYFKTCYNFEVEGLENIPQKGALLIAGNHLSNADPPAIGAFAGLVRDSRFVAKKELFSIPLLGWFFRHCNYIPVDRARQIGDFGALKEVVSALEQGQSVIMFPEGTRSKTGKPQKPKSGIGFLVYKTGVPVLPVRISGTFGWPWVRKIRVKFGTVIHLEKDDALEPKAQYKEFANKIMEQINSIHI